MAAPAPSPQARGRACRQVALSGVLALAIGGGIAGGGAAWFAGASAASAASRPGVVAAATSSPASLLSSAEAAVRGEKGLVETLRASDSNESATLTLHDGTDSGEETGEFKEGGVKGTTTLIDLGSHLYLRGDEGGLSLTDFTSAAAKREANRWIDVPTSTKYGESLSDGLTVSSVAGELGLSGATLTLTKPTTVLGQRVVGVSASASGETVVIYLRDSSKPLPVEISLKVSSEHGSELITFGQWGTVPRLSQPRPTVAFQSSWVKSSS